LCEFPQVDESLFDSNLSAEMDALLRLVSLGSAARNSVKIKVRQPLAELKVQPSDEAEERAVQRFADQICEELNIKKVLLYPSTNGPLLNQEVKPNVKTLGPKFGPRLKEVTAALAAANPSEIAAQVKAGATVELIVGGELVLLEPTDISVVEKAPEGWAGVADRGTQVALDARVTESLKHEGWAREIVRHVQELRKTANLEMEDRIELSLQADSPELRKAIEAHKDYICRETLAVKFTTEPLSGEVHRAEVKVERQALIIELRTI
jgi:isoleucyl-tRNA synthetase